jgi:two-component system LytT family response regulator
MSPLRVLVVDDEGPARRVLRSHLAAEAGVEVVGEAADGPAAVEAIRTLDPDLVFLDVQMPGMTGFEVLESLGADAMPPVVFVTAYDEFALRAFEFAALDYLLKPFTGARLHAALERARRRKQGTNAQGEALGRLLASVRPAPAYLRRIVARKGEAIRLVDVSEVVRLSAEGNYVAVRTERETFLLRETLGRVEARLDPERFARIHRSEIVAVDAVREIQPGFHGDYAVILKSGERLRMSRRYRDRLLGGDAVSSSP